MKNFVIATVSAIALLGNAYANVDAHKKSTEMKEGASAHEMARKENGPHHHKHHAHKHHGHKHAHRFHGHHGQHALAVYVNYPLVNAPAFNACQREYYQGNQEHCYIWHEGYFWYPHAQANMLPGYTAHSQHGAYWYPSQAHPHKVYIDRENMTPHEVYPVQIGSERMQNRDHHRGHKGMHKHGHHHKAKKAHHHADKKMHKAPAAHGEMDKEGMPTEEGMSAAPQTIE
ncbi:MAG: hypothetical protein H0X26_05070 [Alphaproteobacteria bacterium]|nr:hypothetical protein [Alphaproteobacteria bacterium]